jgi:hypothetical protein
MNDALNVTYFIILDTPNKIDRTNPTMSARITDHKQLTTKF